jgi:hypothetical protein
MVKLPLPILKSKGKTVWSQVKQISLNNKCKTGLRQNVQYTWGRGKGGKRYQKQRTKRTQRAKTSKKTQVGAELDDDLLDKQKVRLATDLCRT